MESVNVVCMLINFHWKYFARHTLYRFYIMKELKDTCWCCSILRRSTAPPWNPIPITKSRYNIFRPCIAEVMENIKIRQCVNVNMYVRNSTLNKLRLSLLCCSYHFELIFSGNRWRVWGDTVPRFRNGEERDPVSLPPTLARPRHMLAHT